MTFVPNPLIGEQLKFLPALEGELLVHAERILVQARQVADEMLIEQDEYIPGLHAEAAMTSKGAEARVISDDPATIFLEFGTSKMAARPVLRRAVEAAGYRLEGRKE